MQEDFTPPTPPTPPPPPPPFRGYAAPPVYGAGYPPAYRPVPPVQRSPWFYVTVIGGSFAAICLVMWAVAWFAMRSAMGGGNTGLGLSSQIAVMDIDGFPHPLSAVYRRDTLPHVESLLENDKLRPVFLFDAVRTRRVRPEEMISVDPELRTLRNLNTPEDYLAALKEAGYQPR